MSEVICTHCAQPQRGSARVVLAGVQYPLCHVEQGSGPDCYRLVVIDRHMILNCPCVADSQWWRMEK